MWHFQIDRLWFYLLKPRVLKMRPHQHRSSSKHFKAPLYTLPRRRCANGLFFNVSVRIKLGPSVFSSITVIMSPVQVSEINLVWKATVRLLYLDSPLTAHEVQATTYITAAHSTL
ncbi:hypothetical protein BDN70DRAFT_619694 [Pholiota conissans]|uniref:Uncharacterized protein n=1 Tax=Pholiota conissans TaxID=109636 RepID=A0A9P5Z5G3_9AGAR|nr:hypothetical protein BDN70DRAFT_619694 [Pholiota conissans]